MKKHTGDVVVITGASAGVGRASARAFSENGCRVVLLARGEGGLDQAKKEIESMGGEAHIIPTDVSDYKQLESAAERVEKEIGPINVWVNCAMTTVFGPLWDITPDEYHRVTEVTYLGFVYGTMVALKHMRARNSGTIVQVGSALAYRSIPLQTAYCGSKFGIRGFTDSLRCELKHEGSRVHVTMVQMPGLNTPQFTWCKNYMSKKSQPVPPVYQPEVAARAIVWSAYHKRRELNVGISSVIVIWGNKFFPELGDLYLGKTGFKSQQYDGSDNPGRPDNLFKPLDSDKDAGAHGPFDKKAVKRSLQLFLFTRPGHPLIGVAVMIGFVIWSVYRIVLSFRRSN